jgi:hypothetical protein
MLSSSFSRESQETFVHNDEDDGDDVDCNDDDDDDNVNSNAMEDEDNIPRE